MYYIEKYMNYQLELIDTLWNVNADWIEQLQQTGLN